MLWILKRYKVCFKSETYQSHLKWILTSGPGIIAISQLILKLKTDWNNYQLKTRIRHWNRTGLYSKGFS